MDRRLQLHELLLTFVEHAYFQPPEGKLMEYPCIVYQLDNARTQFAGNSPYRYSKRYQVTVIDRDPDSSIPDKVAFLPSCIFNRFYVADNLNHFVYTLYF